jgi:acetyl-CoA carboxylase biotin carboxylase subunit
MFSKVAIANRGAVAARLVRALRALNIKSVVLCSEADQDLPYVRQADEHLVIGPPPPLDSYLNHDVVLQAAVKVKAQALHPGWGFLSEDFEFAQKVIERGIAFIGPSPKWLKIMGDKIAAKNEMGRLGLPLAPSTQELAGSLEDKIAEAKKLGFPFLIKPSGGGGGIGMIAVHNEQSLQKAIETAQSQALRGFGKGAVYAERLLENPRHVEFQVISDGSGSAVHLFERDCSIQRRRQKVLEEALAPNLDRDSLAKLASLCAGVLGKMGYDHLGTVETLWDKEEGFSFLEVNPRLQVEHGVTEEATGIDLAKMQIKLAGGAKLGDLLAQPTSPPSKHAIEARIYAEDSLRFLPSPGLLKTFRPPKGEGIRVETGFCEGAAITPFYDPMIAQVIASGTDRREALNKMQNALAEFKIEGVKTNLAFLRTMLDYEPYRAGDVHTGLTEELIKSEGYKQSIESL